MRARASLSCMRSSLALVLLALLCCLSLAACGSDEESPAEAKQNLCTSLDGFAASVVALQGVGLSSSEDELNDALDKIDEAWNRVVDDAKDVKSANTDTIRSTYDDLKQAVQNRPTDKPVTEVVSGLQPKLVAFADAWKQFANSVDCNSAS
jgi:gamma-glutamyl:cysteine ligase YbdK (ATP-grasp superfamily)